MSARAIEHLQELTHIATSAGYTTGKQSGPGVEHAAVVLMAGRHDVMSVRPNGRVLQIDPEFDRGLTAIGFSLEASIW